MHECVPHHFIGDIVNDSQICRSFCRGHSNLHTVPILAFVLPKRALFTLGRENYNSKIIRLFLVIIKLGNRI